MRTLRTQVLVVGSGAGGAPTAATLAEHGYDVLVLEEGPDIDTATMATNSTQAIQLLYRNGGMTPMLGNQSIAYVEGRCVGGSTEINSAFWHRLPPECYERWRTDALLDHFTLAVMEPYFERLERELSVSYLPAERIPKSSALFRQGIERLHWQYVEVPRCQRDRPAGSAFAAGAKQSMQRTYLPRARRAGATVLANCTARTLQHEDGRVRGVAALLTEHGRRVRVDIRADLVFLSCGAVHTPALLRRSGITKHIGDTLCIHPMIKAAAAFDAEIEAHEAALPVYQVKEFWPTITIGGAVFTPGFLAMILADNWPLYQHAMRDWQSMALYYAATRGMSRGSIRVIPGAGNDVVVRYRLSDADRRNLSVGLAHLGEVLFAAGAKAVYPALSSHPILTSVDQCRGLLTSYPPVGAMGLSTVHAFSSCPMGENPDYCATDSFGKVRGFRNLYINDASLIPDSPGVNPQGTTMAIALRNLDCFLDRPRRPPLPVRPDPLQLASRRARTPPPALLITGAPGWLGTRLVEVLCRGLPSVEQFAQPDPDRMIRCLVRDAADAAVLAGCGVGVDIRTGDLTDASALRDFCDAAAGSTLFHIAGVVHPSRWTREFDDVNTVGTGLLLEAAQGAGVKRIVAVSSNSPIGCNPHPQHRFDEASPYNPYMAYGRSKMEMEKLVTAAHRSGRIETVVIRPPWFYGPYQPPRQTLFFTMIKDGRFPILGDGNQRRSMAYIDNICQGLLLAATAACADGQTYWIADDRPYTVNEIVDTVERVMEQEFGIHCARKRLRLPALVATLAEVADAGLQAIGVYQQQIHVLGEMNKTIACSIDKAKAELGYAPAVGLREGMAASIAWCLANGQTI